jgi:hypothetical protein
MPLAHPIFYHNSSTAQGMPMPVSAASRSGGTNLRLAHGVGGALGPDVAGQQKKGTMDHAGLFEI